LWLVEPEESLLRQIVFLNGKFVPMAEAVVAVEDRGYQFADGVYDVMKFYGRRPLRLGPHLGRLMDSCAGLRIEGGHGTAEWAEIISSLAERSDVSRDPGAQTILYLQVTRGVAPRNHMLPSPSPKPASVAYFKAPPVYTPEQREQGVALSTQPDERWARCQIKSIALLPVVLAKQAAREAGAFEALLVKDGIVTEGAATNVFCVRGGVAYTHPQGCRILSGVTRGLVMDAASRIGVEVREEPVAIEDFRAADEVFLSSTTMDVMPVTRLDGAPIGNGKVGEVTSRLAEAVLRIIREETGAADSVPLTQ
jgi:D-alanine transaminase